MLRLFFFFLFFFFSSVENEQSSRRWGRKWVLFLFYYVVLLYWLTNIITVLNFFLSFSLSLSGIRDEAEVNQDFLFLRWNWISGVYNQAVYLYTKQMKNKALLPISSSCCFLWWNQIFALDAYKTLRPGGLLKKITFTYVQPLTKLMKPFVTIITFLNLCEIKYQNQIESASCAFDIPPSRIQEFHSNKKRSRDY